MKLPSILFILNIYIMGYAETSSIKTIHLGGGCFWCVEAVFEDVKGVLDVVSGFSGGLLENPSYNQVVSGQTKHAEVCKIVYDEKMISLEQLLEIFFLTHDPTTLNRQGNDIGYHYRSIILFNDTEEEKKINSYIDQLNENIFDNKIVTSIELFKNFYKAEDYHQGYYKFNKEQQYCKLIITPKLLNARKKLQHYY